LKRTDKDLGVAGFTASRNATGQMEVDSVDDGSGAARAGLREADLLLAVNGEPIPQSGSDPWPKWRPGKSVELQIQRSNEIQKLKFLVGVNQEVTFQIEQDAHPSAEQMQVRNGWLMGETGSAAGGR
jgi:predicted metalloprotease with PDZ domain